MKHGRRTAKLSAAALVVALLLAGCAGSRLHSEGKRLVAEGDRESGLARLREAHQREPGNAQFRMDLINESQTYGRILVDRGDEARRQGRSPEAAGFYNRALAVDAGNERARRGLVALEQEARSARLVADSERLLREGNLAGAQERAEAALAEYAESLPARRQLASVREQAEKAQQARAAKAASRSVMGAPVTLQFRDASLRMVFEALSRTTGLNVILDRDVRADLRTTIFVKDAPVEDTVDLILLQNQLAKRTLNASTLFIYPATAAKQKEYQDLQIRTFQIANVDTKYILNVLKTILKVKDVSVDERTGTLVLRDTPEAIEVAAKVIAAHDQPDPEVMLEVEVLEVTRDRLTNLGVKLPSSVSLSTPDTAGTVGALRALTRNDLLVSPLSLTLNLKLEDTDARLLASPKIRARNKEKARILIGDRVPIITNTVTPVNTGSGVVTGSVQYQDVGLKLEFEPQVYTDQEVGIKISLEVSNIVKEIAGPNGSLAYQIGTRNAQTTLRLRDGETQILGGLISSEDRNASSRVPGVGNLPMIGKVFGNNAGTDNKTEVLLSITPRIIRAPAFVDSSVRNVFAGTENVIRDKPMQLDPITEAKAGLPAAEGSVGGASGGAGAVTNGRPGPPQRLPPRILPSNRGTSPTGDGTTPSGEGTGSDAPAAPAASDANAPRPPAPTQ